MSLTTAFLPSGTDMALTVTTQLLLLLVWGTAVWAARPGAELLNVCMDAKHHKERPSPEDQLHEQVGPGQGGVVWGGEELTQEEKGGDEMLNPLHA